MQQTNPATPLGFFNSSALAVPHIPRKQIKMFARLVAVTLFALPLFAAATAVEKRQAGSCNVGELQCCNNVQEVSVSVSAMFLALWKRTPTSRLIGQFADQNTPHRLTPCLELPWPTS